MNGSKKCCSPAMIGYWLLVIGGLNWGIEGLGYFLGKGFDWNVLRMILGSVPWLEGLVYLLVGVSALMVAWGCKCKTCKTE